MYKTKLSCLQSSLQGLAGFRYSTLQSNVNYVKKIEVKI